MHALLACKPPVERDSAVLVGVDVCVCPTRRRRSDTLEEFLDHGKADRWRSVAHEDAGPAFDSAAQRPQGFVELRRE